MRFFYLSVDFWFNSFIVWEHIVYDFCFFNLLRCVLWLQDIVYSGKYSMWAWIKHAEPEMGFSRPKPQCQQGCTSSGVARGESLPCLVGSLEAASFLGWWLLPPSLKLIIPPLFLWSHFLFFFLPLLHFLFLWLHFLHLDIPR